MIVVLTIFFLSVFVYIAQFIVASKKENHARLINMSGRQRMLSQRISLDLSQNFFSLDKKKSTYKSDLTLFLESHQYLSSQSSEDIKSYYRDNVSPIVEKFSDSIKNIESQGDINFVVDFAKFELLKTLDLAVKEFEKEAQKFDSLATNINNLFLFSIILTLSFLSFKILRPQRLKLVETLEEMDERRSEAENALKAKANFLANISHEIRTPLNGIIGITDILIEEFNTKNDKETASQLSLVHQSGNTLNDLINDILDHSQMEHGSLKVNAEAYDPKEMVELLTNMLSPLAKQKGIELKVRNLDRFPKEVKTDQLRTKQILMNVVNNAIKFTKEGQVVIECDYVQEERPLLVFKVSDTGVGIAEHDLENLFESFNQIENPYSKTQEGAGLGLSIAKNLIDLLGGDIEVQSVLDEGTTFTIQIPAFLPMIKTKVIKSDDKKALEKDEGEEFKIKNKVLIVEDNKINQKVIVKVLKHFNLESDIANNGKEAVEMVRDGIYDLILMDLSMPKMNGFEATIEIRKFNLEVPIFTLSANAFEEDKTKAQKAGMNEFLAKPIRKDELAKLLRKYF
ncbi:MAG: response regulator [Oligoflexia bacterium]|nr:response regulator [Oligoflexia bacterium]